MSSHSWRELEHAVRTLEVDSDRREQVEITVEWRDAAPEARPDGMTWEPPTADEPGVLAYDLWQAQRDAKTALESGEFDIVAFLAGYGSGKTLLGARWTIANALAYPGSRFLVMGQDYAKAKPTTFNTLLSQLPGERTHITTSGFNGPQEQSPIVADYNRQDNRLYFTNDTEVILGSADNWSRYAGLEVGGVWLDEPAHYGDDLFDLLEMLGGRLRGVDGPKRQLWTTTGAGMTAAWRVLEEREDTNGDPIGLNIELIRASTLENPYLTKGELDHFKRQYEGTKRAEQALRGGFAAAEGLVYDQFSPSTHVVDHEAALERTGEGWRVYGYDAGWNDPRVVLEAGKTDHNELVILDEFYESGTHVDRAIEWLNRNNKPTGAIYCEHEPADIEKFSNAGWNAEQADKSIDAGIAEVRARLREAGNKPIGTGSEKPPPTFTWGERSAASAEDPDTDPDPDRVGLLISERCENLRRELQSYKEEHVGGSAAVDHAADALRYLCMGVADTGTNVTVRTARVSTSNTMPEDRR